MKKKIAIILIFIILLTCSLSVITVFATNTNAEVYVENIIEQELISISSDKSENSWQISAEVNNEILADMYSNKNWSKLDELADTEGYVYEPVYIQVPEGTSSVKAIIESEENNLEIVTKDNELYAKYDNPIFKKEGNGYTPLINISRDGTVGQKNIVEIQIIATNDIDAELMSENISLRTQFKMPLDEGIGASFSAREQILGGMGSKYWQMIGISSGEDYTGCQLQILTSKKLKGDSVYVDGIGNFVYEDYNSDNIYQSNRYKYIYDIKDNRLNKEVGNHRYYIVVEDEDENKELVLLDLIVSGEQEEIQNEAKLSNTIPNNIVSFKEQNKYLDYTGEITIDNALLNDDATWEYFENNNKLEEKLYIKITGVSPIFEDECYYKIKRGDEISDLQKLHILKSDEEGYVQGEVWATIPITLLEKEDYQINCADNVDIVNEIRLYLNTEEEYINDDSYNQTYSFKIITKNELVFEPSMLEASDFTRTSLGYKADIHIDYGTQLQNPKILYICNLKDGGQSYFVTDIMKGKTATTQLVIDNTKIDNVEVWLMDGNIDFSGNAFAGVKADVLELSVPE